MDTNKAKELKEYINGKCIQEAFIHGWERAEAQSETRVYVVDALEHDTNLTDDAFMTLAEELGTVYTLDNFAAEFNWGRGVSSGRDIIRFIYVQTNR